MPLHMQRVGFDPVAELARLRADEAVTRVVTPFGLPAWLVTRAEDVRAMLSDPVHFSNSTDVPLGDLLKLSEEELARRRAGQLLSMDPPPHTRLRRMLTPEFTVRRIRRLAPRIAEIVDDHLADLERDGPPADLVPRFALPIPSLVICELLGVPYAERERFQRLTARQLDLSVPLEQRLRLADGTRLLATHVAPGQNDGSGIHPSLPDETLASLLAGCAADLVCVGHTHWPLDRRVGGVRVI
jgi:cytochrome P450